MPAKKLTLAEVRELMDPSTRAANMAIVARWVARDDGVAVYENQAFDSKNLGHRKFVSFGSRDAQLETDEPPERLPDIGSQINWAYQLVGTYRRCCERDDDGDGDCDIHHDDVPDDFLELVYREMERRPHWFQVLTKRAGNAARFLHRSGRAGRLPPNIWIGTTAGDPKHAERRLVELAGVPASNLFVSMEPLLGMINPVRYLGRELHGGGRIRWVIAGGKSGRNPRPSHPEWFRLVRDTCARADTTFFFKQWGLYEPVGHDEVLNTDIGVEIDGTHYSMGGLAVPGRPGATTAIMRRVRAVDPAPRLDGRTHLDFPPGWTP